MNLAESEQCMEFTNLKNINDCAKIYAYADSIEEYIINRDLACNLSRLSRIFDPIVVLAKHNWLFKILVDTGKDYVPPLIIMISSAFALAFTIAMCFICPYATSDSITACGVVEYLSMSFIMLAFFIRMLDVALCMKIAMIFKEKGYYDKS